MPLTAIALVSAGALAYEVLLTRLFAIIQWHHFAYMVISTALLGYGASGTFLALAQARLRARFTTAFGLGAALFGLSAMASFALAERLPFNALAVLWEPRQLLFLPVLSGLLAVPFFCAATSIGLALACFPDRIARIYRYDMVGAGIGAFGIVAALFVLSPASALKLVSGLGLIAAALVSLSERSRTANWRAAAYALAAVAMIAATPASWIALLPSEYKGLSQALRVHGAAVLSERSSPLGLITVVSSPNVPFRHVPGLSLNTTVEPLPQLGAFIDGDGPSVITAFDGRMERLEYLDDTSAALPYHLLQRPEVLILGAGGGVDVLLALYHRAAKIDAVELNPQLVWLVKETYADFAGHLYDRPEVRAHVAEARGFVAGRGARYDLIQIPLLDSFAASAGTLSLSENYVYTIEAFEQYLRQLRPGGYLAITRWLKLPPRDSLKLFATAVAALERSGVGNPGRQLALIRSLNTTTLLVKNGPLTEEDIATIRRFADERSFDLAFHPGMRRDEANRYNLLDEPYFFDGAAALIGPERRAFLQRYKFDVAPVTDDRPFFFDFFTWRALPELLQRRTMGGAALLDWGYPILVATLAQAVALSLVLILAPLWFGHGRPVATAAQSGRVALYFLAIGLGFLFIEIASIQRFILFLSHPLYATAVVLCAFLIFAGIGSGLAPRLEARLAAWRKADPDVGSGVPSRGFRLRIPIPDALPVVIAAIVFIALLHLLLLPPLVRWLMPLSEPIKIIVTLGLIAPLAVWMGMPFPLALSRIAAQTPALVPWAWGINGCASVVSAVAATLLAMNIGFAGVIMTAIGLYALACAAFWAPQRADIGTSRQA